MQTDLVLNAPAIRYSARIDLFSPPQRKLTGGYGFKGWEKRSQADTRINSIPGAISDCRSVQDEGLFACPTTFGENFST